MSRNSSQRIFTVEEANGLVPELNEIFEAIRTEHRALDAVKPDIEKAAANAALGGGSRHGRRYVEALMRISDLVDRVTDMGVVVKDVEKGLCDFLFDRGDNLVFLCWKSGEPEVGWWHALEEGYPGRRDIEDLTDGL